MPQKKKSWIRYLVIAVIVAVAYFLNIEIQTRLGQNALAATGLQPLPLNEALSKAATDQKLVLAKLSAIWCPTCRSLDKRIFANPEVQQILQEKYVFARIEYESPEGAAFIQAYDAQTFPTLLVLAPSGAKLHELPVTTDPEEFIRSL